MTKIADLRLERLWLPFETTMRFGERVVDARDLVLLGLATDEGLLGWGEVADPPPTAELVETISRLRSLLLGRRIRPEAAEAVPVGADISVAAAARSGEVARVGQVPRIGEVAEALEGVEAGALERATEGADAVRRSTLAAVETALLDLVGRLAGRPLAALLGEPVRRRVAVNGLVDATRVGPEAAAERSRALVATGIRTLKLKVDPDSGATARLLRAVRAAVGTSVALRLDPNGRLSEAEAAEWLDDLRWADLEYVEQPIRPEAGPEGLARLRRAVPIPIAADEAVTDRSAAEALLAAGACDVLVVKPSRVGGPREARAIAAAAASRGARVTISTLYETGIGLAAALHVAATLPGPGAHGLATLDLLADDLILDDLGIVDGTMAVPPGAGLGVRVDEGAVGRYRVGPAGEAATLLPLGRPRDRPRGRQ